MAVGLPAGLVVHATAAGTPGFAAGDVIDEIAEKEYVPAGVAEGPSPPEAS
jgi:hypothetical protein